MAMQSRFFKSYRKLCLVTALGATALTSILPVNTASAFHFHGGLGGGFHNGGFHNSNFHAFATPMTTHFSGLRDPGFGRHPVLSGGLLGHGPVCFHGRCVAIGGPNQLPPRLPPRLPCINELCGGPTGGGPTGGPHGGPQGGPNFGGPIGGPVPVLVATVGAVGVGYYYGDQPIYYRSRLVHAAATCGGPVGTYVLMGFVPTATAEQIAAFLQSFKVVVSDGPDQDSIFVIKLADQKLSEKDVQTAMMAMQTETSVVRIISQQDAAAARN